MIYLQCSLLSDMEPMYFSFTCEIVREPQDRSPVDHSTHFVLIGLVHTHSRHKSLRLWILNQLFVFGHYQFTAGQKAHPKLILNLKPKCLVMALGFNTSLKRAHKFSLGFKSAEVEAWVIILPSLGPLGIVLQKKKTIAFWTASPWQDLR